MFIQCRGSGDLMIGVFDSGSILVIWFLPWLAMGHYNFVWHFILTVPLSTQVYKWVPVNLMLGVILW